MTDLSAYEAALVERVARAMDSAQIAWKAANGGDDASCVDMPEAEIASAALRALGLIGPDQDDPDGQHPPRWLAPWAETDAMYHAGIAAFQDPKNRHGDVLGEVFDAMRDAHLKEGTT